MDSFVLESFLAYITVRIHCKTVETLNIEYEYKTGKQSDILLSTFLSTLIDPSFPLFSLRAYFRSKTMLCSRPPIIRIVNFEINLRLSRV